MKIEIISGEGTGEGTIKIYTGKMTAKAINMAMKKERLGYDRWVILRCKDTRFINNISKEDFQWMMLEENHEGV